MNLLARVDTLMTKNLITINQKASVKQAKMKLDGHGIHHLLVVNDFKKLVGMVSYLDFAKVYERHTEGLEVSAIMTKPLVKLERTDTVRTAANLFLLNRFHALPVEDDGDLVGILTTFDLVKLIDREEIKLTDYV
ncbi:CBS domain-containing protein [Neolewinella antarctica]|uniref:CBS domain-containing protein n=1 Tax=Neolewinella antarctica TaxID=442734 RepID=A0ABX0X9A0_9BACT|nr:CBS domain-containing protein [Neolewinella antarctica]NJC25581.1 CBS domain-containing protein [Neolewinella antarctica]